MTLTTPDPKKKRRLSMKEKKFAEEFVLGKDPGNATEAAMQSYNVKNRGSAAVIGARNLQKTDILENIEMMMEKHDIDDNYMVERLKEGMEAKEIANYKGEAVETSIPDHNVRFKYWDAAAKIKRLYPNVQIDTRNLNIDVEIENMSKEELSDVLTGALKSLKENDNSKRKKEPNSKEV